MPSNEFIPALSRKFKSHAGVDNWAMRKLFCFGATVLILSGLLTACEPSLNWRASQIEGSNLSFDLPCKPDKTVKPVNMAGLQLELAVVGCEADDAVWAVMSTQVPPTADRDELLQGWRQATLKNIRASQVEEVPWTLGKIAVLPGAISINALGFSATGQPVSARAVWFSHVEGNSMRMVHAVVYQNKKNRQNNKQSADQLIESLKLP